MYFKKLEIFGFKSFAEKTVFNFEQGITAIVGPNGCGKSNVFDAIRWVLGEQSVKQLRGGAMEDVIFNGTDTKLALGFAEVSVTFDNASRTLPINADDVLVTRRLFRSGESEYLINKEVTRLKDITELFMGTGVGAEAYSLVQQGRVDLVVSAKPEDRRMIFDEAAGITKYKAKKREAQNKLKDTDQNLLRINDIVVEVKRQIGSIERQAQKAQRYKEEFEKLKGFEQIMALYQFSLADKEKAEIQAFLDDVRGREDLHSGELEEFRQVVERESMLLEDLELKVQEVREQEIKLGSQIELQTRHIGFNEERLCNIDENETRLSEQKAQLVEKCQTHQAKIAALENDLAALLGSVEASIGTLNEKRSSLVQVSALIDEYQQSIRQDEEKILSMTSRQVEINNQLTENMKESQGFLARRRRLDVERAKVTAEREEVDRKLQGVSQGIMDIVSKRQQLWDDVARERGALAHQNEELAVLNSRIESLERKKLFLLSQKEFIEKLQVQYDDMPDPVVTGRFLSTAVPSEKHTGIVGKVKSVRAFTAEHLSSLKQQLEGLEGETVYEVICESKYLELDPQEMLTRIDAVEAEIKRTVIERDSKVLKIAEQSKLVERIQADIHSEEKRLSVCEAQQVDISVEAKKILSEIETVEMETLESDEAITRLKTVEDALREDLRIVEEEVSFAREDIRGRQEMLQQKRKDREAAAVAVAQTEVEAVALRDKEQGWRSNLEMFRRDLNGYLEDMTRLNSESHSFDEKRAKFREEIAQLEEEIARLHVEKEELRATLSRHEAERQDVDQRLSSVRAQILGIEKEIANNRDALHTREMRIQQIDFQMQAIKERMLQRYQIDFSVPVAEVTSEGGESVGTPQVDIEALALEIQTLTKRCESFGGVNLMAIEEFEELKNRFQFLTKQQSDLLTAKDMLEQTIRKINRTTRELFVDTFNKVNEQLRIHFKMLFNGGEAQLILVDPENALESGIEIVARPPGKKLQTITLLSGGEKTMTAIALIFSVFKVNPSPFCVLDEIDAALDEANVDRFALVLKEFAKIAQFIVITHNKKTIANANVMYGVTMQQRGVSRVVSVKFSEFKDGTGKVESERVEFSAPEKNDAEPVAASVQTEAVSVPEAMPPEAKSQPEELAVV